MRRIAVLCFIAVFALASTAYATGLSASTGQTARAMIAQVLTVSVNVPLVNFGTYTAGFITCKVDTSTIVTVTSSSSWTLGAFTSTANAAGQLTSGTSKMLSPLQVRASTVPAFQNIDAIGIDLLKNQVPAVNRQVNVVYQLCSDIADLPNASGSFYSIPISLMVVSAPFF